MPDKVASPESSAAAAPVASPADNKPVVDSSPQAIEPTEANLEKLTPAELTQLQRTAKQRKTGEPAVSAPAVGEHTSEKVVDETAKAAAEKEKADADAIKEAADKQAADEAAAAEDAKNRQYRLRGKDPEEDAVYALVRGGKSLKEATELIYGAVKKDDPKKEKVAEPDAIAEADKQIDSTKKEIVDLEAKLLKADEESDLKEHGRILREINARERAIDRLEVLKEARQIERERAVQADGKKRELADYERTVAAYPELGDKKSSVYTKFTEFFRAKEAIAIADSNSDEAAVLALPNWRSTLAREFAEQEGLVPASRREAKPPVVTDPKLSPPAKVERPQASGAKVVTTKDGPSKETFEVTKEQVERSLEDLDAKDLGKLMRERDTLRRQQKTAA